MARISIISLTFDTEDFSDDLQAAVDLLLEQFLKEKTGLELICNTYREELDRYSYIPRNEFKKLDSFVIDLSGFKNLDIRAPLFRKSGFDIFLKRADSRSLSLSDLKNRFEDIKESVEEMAIVPSHDGESYAPLHGVFSKFLWVNPKEIHDRMKQGSATIVINSIVVVI